MSFVKRSPVFGMSPDTRNRFITTRRIAARLLP